MRRKIIFNAILFFLILILSFSFKPGIVALRFNFLNGFFEIGPTEKVFEILNVALLVNFLNFFVFYFIKNLRDFILNLNIFFNFIFVFYLFLIFLNML